MVTLVGMSMLKADFPPYSILLLAKPIAHNPYAIWGQNTFRMKLHTLDIIFFMLKPHNITIFVAGGNFQLIGWETIGTDDPAMIASYRKIWG